MSEMPHGSSAPGADDELDDPGRDPVGLHPTRDVLDSVGGADRKGEYTPGRPSEAERRAGNKPDEPPTGSEKGPL